MTMKMNRWSNFLAVALTSAALAFPAAAMGPMPDAGHSGHRPIEVLLKCLSVVGLTDTQKADIKTFLESEKPIMEGLADKLKTDGAALKTALQANPADPCAVGGALLTVQADGKALKTEGGKVVAGVEALLTPEQKSKFEGCLAGMHHESAPESLESLLEE